MIRTLFRSEDFPPEDRFEQWCEVVARQLLPKRMSMQRAGEFRGSIRTTALGAVQLAQVAYSPLRCSREPAHVRREDSDDIEIHLLVRGSATVDVGGRQESAAVGDMVVHGSGHPYVIHTQSPGAVVKLLTLNVSRSVLTVSPRHVDRLMGRSLPAEGTGAILASLLKDAFATVDQGPALLPPEALRLGDAISSLASAVIARHAGAQGTLPAETHQQVLLQRIHGFIDAHLADPELSPQAVADALHLSVRQLHRLFQQDSTSVSAWIRQRRLERCKTDLLDPRLADQPIHAIAMCWGFTHPADFTRAFRAAYGMTPSDCRANALGG